LQGTSLATIDDKPDETLEKARAAWLTSSPPDWLNICWLKWHPGNRPDLLPLFSARIKKNLSKALTK